MSEEQRVSTGTVDNAFKALMRQSSQAELFRSLPVYSVLALSSLSWKKCIFSFEIKKRQPPNSDMRV